MNEHAEASLKPVEMIPTDDAPIIQEEQNVEQSNYIVNDDDIQKKRGNYIFTVGNVSSGKSTLQNLLIYRLWNKENINFKYINKDGDHRHEAILDSWVEKLGKGYLPARTQEGELQEFSIAFSQGNKKNLEINFLEISGEDIKHIVPTLNKNTTPGLNKQLDDYLRLKKRQINKRFIFVSDAKVNRKNELNNETDNVSEESEDILFNHLLQYLMSADGLNMKKINILFVIAKWDVVAREYKTVEEYISKNFPQTKTTLSSKDCNTVYIPFSVGKVAEKKVKDEEYYEEKIVSLESQYVDRLIHWIYYTYTHNTLKGFPKIKPTFFDRIARFF